MTTGLPFDDFRELLRHLPPQDSAAAARVVSRRLAASSSRLDHIATWIAASTGRAPPQILRPLVAIFAGTHGVARHLPMQAADTQALVDLCAAGGAPVNQVCAAQDLGLKVFDLALHLPVVDITTDAAMDERGCAATMAFGMEAIAGGVDLVCVGAIGGGGELVASAIFAALFGGEVEAWVGGEGAAQAARADLVRRALALHGANLKDPLELLRRLGGREFAAIAGAILAARMQKIAVILDGAATLAAAAVLKAANPAALDHCQLGHLSTENGCAAAAERLGLDPLLRLDMADGQGTGAAVAYGVVKTALQIHNGIAAARRA